MDLSDTVIIPDEAPQFNVSGVFCRELQGVRKKGETKGGATRKREKFHAVEKGKQPPGSFPGGFS